MKYAIYRFYFKEVTMKPLLLFKKNMLRFIQSIARKKNLTLFYAFKK
jgi:hypothetical protein